MHEEEVWTTPSTTTQANPFAWLQLFFGAYMVYTAQDIKSWKINPIENDKTNFPDRLEDASLAHNAYDMEWALQTNEVTAWQQMIDTLNGVYGIQIVLWGMNYWFDGLGGAWHQLYYRYSQLMQVLPFWTLYRAIEIQNAYAPNNQKFGEYSTEYTAAYYNYRPYLYDPESVDTTSIHYLHHEDHERQENMMILSFAAFAVSIVTQGGIREEYFQQYDRKLIEDQAAVEKALAGESEEN